MMAEGTFELHPGDALYPETVLELSDVPQTLYVRGATPRRFRRPRSPSSVRERPRRMVLPWQSLRQRLRSRRE